MTPESEPNPPFSPVPDSVPRAYANFLLVEPGGMDATIAFAHQVGASPPQWLVRVSMSWEEARFLNSVLSRQLEMYEQTYGEVRDVTGRAQEALKRQEEEESKRQGRGDA